MSGEFVDPFPWLRDEPSKADKLFRVLLVWAKCHKWPKDVTGEATFYHAQLIDQAADDATTFDIPYDASTPDNARPIPTIRELLTLDDDALARAFNRAPDRLQRYIETLAREDGARIDPCGVSIIAPPDLRRILNRIVGRKGGALKGRPNAVHVDAVADAVVRAYADLSGKRPGVSRAGDVKESLNGWAIYGPLVRFAGIIGMFYELPLDEENRLRAAIKRGRPSRAK